MKSITRTRPTIGRLNHVAIEVADLPSALYFYQDILGLNQLPMPEGLKEKGIYWIDLGQSLALHLIEKPDSIPGTKAHLAITVDDLTAWRQYLEWRGVNYVPPRIMIYKAERIFITDPSGNRIELVKWL